MRKLIEFWENSDWEERLLNFGLIIPGVIIVWTAALGFAWFLVLLAWRSIS